MQSLINKAVSNIMSTNPNPSTSYMATAGLVKQLHQLNIEPKTEAGPFHSHPSPSQTLYLSSTSHS